jgi:hypothetical protein
VSVEASLVGDRSVVRVVDSPAALSDDSLAEALDFEVSGG